MIKDQMGILNSEIFLKGHCKLRLRVSINECMMGLDWIVIRVSLILDQSQKL